MGGPAKTATLMMHMLQVVNQVEQNHIRQRNKWKYCFSELKQQLFWDKS